MAVSGGTAGGAEDWTLEGGVRSEEEESRGRGGRGQDVKVEEVRVAMGDGFGFLLALGIGPSDYFQLQLVCGLQFCKRFCFPFLLRFTVRQAQC